MSTPNSNITKDGFRLRGTAFSRLDAFSDVVFGFALTLLVVSVEVPHTYSEFHALLPSFVPFAICFLLFILVWDAHFRFFRRYGLHDNLTIVINSVLLFTVLFYVYPLKFLFVIAAVNSNGQQAVSNYSQLRELMIVYGLGFTAIYLCITALLWNAWRLRDSLALSPLEVTITLSNLWLNLGIACIGLLCCLIARLLPAQYSGDAGWFFFLIAPWSTLHGFIAGRHIKAARARTTPEDLLPFPTAAH